MLYKNKFINSSLFFFRYTINRNKYIRNRKSNTFMIHTGRVGSTVLADLLNQHPEIHWDGEFYPRQQDNFFKFIYKDSVKHLKIRMNQYMSNHYGFELKCPTFELFGDKKINMNLKDYINEISLLNVNHFILLKRDNYLKQLISFINARETKIHHIDKTKEFKRKVQVNVKSCIWFRKEMPITEHFEYLDDHYKKITDFLNDKNLLCLSYENDIQNDPKKAYHKTCQFLGVKTEEPNVNLKRTNPFPLSEIISNYNEVEDELKNTKYEWMLYD